jgi:hypothetical protein
MKINMYRERGTFMPLASVYSSRCVGQRYLSLFALFGNYNFKILMNYGVGSRPT